MRRTDIVLLTSAVALAGFLAWAVSTPPEFEYAGEHNITYVDETTATPHALYQDNEEGQRDKGGVITPELWVDEYILRSTPLHPPRNNGGSVGPGFQQGTNTVDAPNDGTFWVILIGALWLFYVSRNRK